MLGLVARANGHEILPNYQVRYSLPDYDHFKNSLVKNVAIVDGVLHGRDWKGNRGGSGFGKWGKLPQPSAIAWVKQETWDFFAGTHDGYADLGVDYFRKVLFLRGFGWIVRDLFESADGRSHDFQQVWQGHYSDEGGGNHHRSAFADGSGLDIVQLGDRADDWSTGVLRGKGRLVHTRTGASAGFATLLFPFRAYNERVPESLWQDRSWSADGWTLQLPEEDSIETAGVTTDARVVLMDATGIFLLNASWLEAGGRRARFSERSDLRIDRSAGPGRSLTWLGHRPGNLEWIGEDSAQPGATLQPGSRVAWAE
jgi:hypothetical protein